MSRLLAWLVVWGLWGCVDTPPPAPPTEGTVCLSTVLEERAEGDALALLAPPPYRPSCQYSHPADYWARGCEGPDALCSYCELASMAYHNRAAELGCCREWVCSWTEGRTPEDAARAFDAAQTCTELQTARHP